MQNYHTTLTNKTILPGNVDLLRFTLAPGETLRFTAGQYVILTVPHEVMPVKRLYSIASSSQDETSFELIIKRVPGGIASRYIETFHEGQNIEFQGPAGLFALKDTSRDKVFLTTGTGIAPIRSFLRSSLPHAQKCYLFWGLPTLNELYLFDELKQLARTNPNLKVTICLSREQSLESVKPEDRGYFSLGHIHECVEPLILQSPPNTLEYYICGRREVVESVRQHLYDRHTDKESVVFERY